MDQTADRRSLKWTAKEWEMGCGVVSRRLLGAPAHVRASAVMKRMAADLDLAFVKGDADAFCRVGVKLCLHCDAISKEQGIAPWWKIPPRNQTTATDSTV